VTVGAYGRRRQIFRVAKLPRSQVEALGVLTDNALGGLSWYQAGKHGETPLWRIVDQVTAGGEESGCRRAPAGVLGVWAEAGSGEPEGLVGAVAWESDGDTVRLAPWTPLTYRALSGAGREEAGLALLRAVGAVARDPAGAARLVQAMRVAPADRGRAEELIEVYLRDGFGREDRLALTLTVTPGATQAHEAAAGSEASDHEPEIVLSDPTRAEDMELLTRLFIQCFADSADPMGRRTAADETAARTWLEEAAGGRKGTPETDLWRVVVVDGRPAGFILANNRGAGEYYVADVGILPKLRGRGLARSLLVDVVELARQRGARRLTAIVHRDNAASLRLFRSTGFEVSGWLTVLEKPVVTKQEGPGTPTAILKAETSSSDGGPGRCSCCSEDDGSLC